MPHPNRGPARARSCRRTSSSGVSGSHVTVCWVPLTTRQKSSVSISPSQHRARAWLSVPPARSASGLTIASWQEYAFVCRERGANRKAEDPDMDDRLAMAISHWAPRFTTNGVTAGDFDRIVNGISSWDEWCSAWSAVGVEHEQVGRDALAAGRTISAGEHLSRA